MSLVPAAGLMNQGAVPSAWLTPVLLSTTLVLTGTVAIVSVSLGEIAADFSVNSATLSWVVNGYLLAYGGALVLGGRLGDLLGARTTLLAGLSLFLVGAAAGSLASSAGILILARVLQGLGAALAAPSVLALVTSVYPADQRARIIGAWTATTSAGFSLGLVAGGAIQQWSSWRWIFVLAIPLTGALLLLSARIVPKVPRRRQSLDVWGALLVTGFASVLVLSLVLAAAREGLSGAALAVAILLLIFCIWRARAAAVPLIPRELFASPARMGALVAIAFSGAAVTGMLFILSQLFTEELALGPLAVGATFLLFSVPSVAGTMLFVRLTKRRDGRLAGPVFFLVAALGMVAFVPLASTGSLGWSVVAGLVAVGLGVGGGQLAANRQVLLIVPNGLGGAASGMLQTALQLGAAIGTAILVLVDSLFSLEGVFLVSASMLLAALLCLVFAEKVGRVS